MAVTCPGDFELFLGYSSGLGRVSENGPRATSVVWKEEPKVATLLKLEKVLVARSPKCTRSVSKQEEEMND